MTSKAVLRGASITTRCRLCGQEYDLPLVAMVRNKPCPHCHESSEPKKVQDGIQGHSNDLPGVLKAIQGRELPNAPRKITRKIARLFQKL